MTNEEFLEMDKKQKALLDSLDLKRFIHSGSTPAMIMEDIENAYSDHEFPEEVDKIVEGPDFQGYFFNFWGEYDFMDYLHDRYGVRWSDEITYWVGPGWN